jgi:DeoR/GlpR family transcriptional regulator of sugar metabolism
MLKEERHQYILHRLREAGRVMSLDLSAALGISEDTVRRDLMALEREGKLRRAHGGALPLVTGAEPYREREQRAPEAKQSLARAALPLLAGQPTIILDASTTNVQVALALPPECAATVVTTSPPIAMALMSHPKV